ncbi:MAG: Gfo/Idh/MocA family oxidoreductase [Limnochordia bacterium]|nr:Gfo/Idh/MocA family oxidoreductase [Limnochordia bacterium]MDD2629290.1 Gfo/Idh/MocA family oxidoreductase [Limnochordia bacterium]
MKKIKVGIIGVGGIAQTAHIPSWRARKDAEIVAIADINEQKLKQVKEKFMVPHAFTDYREMLAMDEIDVVSVCTPNLTHGIISKDALKAGKHVLCEKPVAVTGKEAEDIAQTAKAVDRIFMGAFCRRFEAASQEMRRRIEQGELGNVYYAKAGYLRRSGIPGLGGWFTDKSRSGGGCMLDIGVHALDLTYWLMGAPEPVSVTGSVYQKFGETAVDGGWPPNDTRVGDVFTDLNDVEDCAFGSIKFANGATLNVEASWAAHVIPGSYLQLLGDKGGIRQDAEGTKLLTTINGEQQNIALSVQDHSSYAEEISHLVDCIKHNRAPLTRPEEIIDVSYIIEAIYLSSERGKEVLFSDLKGR